MHLVLKKVIEVLLRLRAIGRKERGKSRSAIGIGLGSRENHKALRRPDFLGAASPLHLNKAVVALAIGTALLIVAASRQLSSLHF
jgi:hypothetical protein